MTSMRPAWQQWCRLCAKEDAKGSINIFLDEAKGSKKAAIRRYFDVDIDEEDTSPKAICSECFSLISSLLNYADHVAKVQKMYQTLEENRHVDHSDFEGIRLRFGLLSEERPQTCLQQPMAPVQFVVTKTEISDEEAMSAEEIEDPTNPLENTLLDDIKTEEELTQLESDDDKSDHELKETAADDYVEMRQISEPMHTKKCSESRNADIGEEPTNEHNKSCHLCHKTVKNLRLHLKRAHAVPEQDLLQRCDQCPQVFATENKLQKHQRTHLPIEIRNTIPCPECESKFSTKVLLRLHISRMHKEIRLFICEECGISVRTKASLRVHMLTHRDYMPFVCEICQKGFRHKCALKVHLDTHDPHKHICGVCGTELSTKLMLTRHMVVHSDALQHKCDFCGRGFKRSKTLKSHLLTHTGIRPYACEFCDCTFTTLQNCRAHKKRRHDDELAASHGGGGSVTFQTKLPKLKELKELIKAAKAAKEGNELPSNNSSLQEI